MSLAGTSIPREPHLRPVSLGFAFSYLPRFSVIRGMRKQHK